MRLKFEIDHAGEIGAGIHGFTDIVTIDVESGDPGGEPGEFMVFMQSALAEWYDGANVDAVDVTDA